MKTASIKKCIAFLLFATIVCIDNTAMAQIKVVDDSYAENLSATKSYYDREVDFEKYFPSVSKGHIYPYSSMYPYIVDEKKVNLIGDTIYLCEPLSVYITNCNTSHSFKLLNGKATFESFVMPSGYYMISGYVFCADNEDTLRLKVGLKPFNGKMTSRELKKEIIEKGERFEYRNDLSKYQRLLVLKPLNGDTVTTYYLYSYYDYGGKYTSIPLQNLNEISVLQRFYSQIKTFIGKEVYRVYEQTYWSNDVTELIIDDNRYTDITWDGITGDPVKLEDVKFIVQDVVLKKGKYGYDTFIVLKGEKTGAFTKKITSICYAFSEDDVREKNRKLPNITKDIPVLKADNDGFIIRSNDLKKIKQRTNALQAQREREIQQQAAKEESALARQMIAKFGAEYGGLIAKKQISIGMTKEMCKAAWGYPMNTYRTTTRFGQSEVWCYNYKSRVYFFEGKVVQIDD